MAITTTAPYTSGVAVTTVLRRYRDKGLSLPITTDVLIRAGVTESLVKRTLQAMQLLDLIDEAGQPTPIFQKMRTVPEVDYKACLQEWLKSAYSEVFQYVDPMEDDASRVRDAFRTYVPHGQQDRMVSLFLALCAEAGLAPEQNRAEAKPRARKSATPRAAVSRSALGGDTGNSSPAHSPAGRQRQVHFSNTLPPALAGLIQSIPAAERGWTKVERDRFYDTFGTVLDFAIPIRANPADEPFDDGFGE